MKISSREIRVWTEIFYKPESRFIKEFRSGWETNKKILIGQSAGLIYKELRQSKGLFVSPYPLKKDFKNLSEEEKSDWYDFVSAIPVKLKSMNLYLRPYKEFCRTCLIPYSDIETLAKSDHERFLVKHTSSSPFSLKGKEVFIHQVPYYELPEEVKRFYIEINHLIPVSMKALGYEIVKPAEMEEITDRLVYRLAKAIHSRYLKGARKEAGNSEKKSYSLIFGHEDKLEADFDRLWEDIRHSNLDNAFHIPTKLLSVGYLIRPVSRGFKPAALRLNVDEIETMARVEHLRWCWDKILHGWHYGIEKDSKKKTHPGIVPFDDLSDSEKEKDRELVQLIPSLLQDIGYEAVSVSRERIGRLPYATRPMSSIHRILEETRRLNDQIRNALILPPEVEEMLKVRNRKIEEAIREVESGYTYAQHIQETFLPDNLYVRYCFPESFILFRPKDIVSGDFYFFSRQENRLIFAVADCTGHGIPGALLSTIGYSILDQSVNELKLDDPVKILDHLYSRIHKFLRLDSDGSGIADDMDIMLCILDTELNQLRFSGVKNPLYHLHDGNLTEYKCAGLTDDFSGEAYNRYTSCKIRLEQGDTLYLFSDGYSDQFGGAKHKKYSSARFKSYLTSIHQLPMAEQSEKLYEEIEHWRGENNEDQTDDILVIGVKI